MSHLLSNPVHKPYLFDLPRPAPSPITPPETDNEFVVSAPPALPERGAVDTETHSSYASASLAPMETLHRKVPSISYLNSGLRSERTVQRTSLKWLVVVLPPASFSREHGHFGHTLSTGQPDRLSQGLLMPLYHTMSSQLSAIAREFNLPSISGLCLYLRANQSGLALNPRISDESWPLLWSHLFDARSPALPPQQLPVSGQIEFDIDIAKARWYDVWIGISRRDFADVPHSVDASRRQSISHGQGGDSRTSILDEHGDDQLDNISLFPQANMPFIAPRHAPKKLSLLDRLDSSSAISAPRGAPRHLSPTEDARMLRVLSPIVQEEEPKTARRDIDIMVNSWRASATISRSPLAATGQTSLDHANMPNTLNDLPLPSPEKDVYEMNLDDYTWSISSAGPLDYDPEAEDLMSWVYPPSVHLDRRLEGSVLLTPSSYTSFGPPDDDFDYFAMSYASRLPSPDLGMRQLEDAPLTPATATSWGAPLSYPPSPVESFMHHRAPSVDIAMRHMHSRPVTPATATSWGAPSWPPSPVSNEYLHRMPSPDLAERGLPSAPATPLWAAPQYAPLSSQPWKQVWPYNEHLETAPSPSRFVFPYYAGARGETHHERDVSVSSIVPRPSAFVFPYYKPGHGEDDSAASVAPYASDQAKARFSQFVFPRYKPGHSAAAEAGKEQTLSQGTVASPSAFVFPYYSATRSTAMTQQIQGSSGASSVASAGYPHFNLYPAVYPFFDLYPASTRLADSDVGIQVSVHLGGAYPVLNLYPAVYPHLEIYPGNVAPFIASADTALGFCVILAPAYPTFRLYPAVYPNNLQEIYPPVGMLDVAISADVEVRLPVYYPSFDLYAPVYPHNLDRIYLPSSTSIVSRSLIIRRVRRKSLPSTRIPIGVSLSTLYPAFDIYKSSEAAATRGITIQLPVNYPTFDLYPAVYPNNVAQIYLPMIERDGARANGTSFAVGLPVQYPTMDIYPWVYPYNLDGIYPGQHGHSQSRSRKVSGTFVKLPNQYPSIVHSVYLGEVAETRTPRNKLTTTVVEANNVEVVISLDRSYPSFKLYPAVYPYSLGEIYPPVATPTRIVSAGASVKLPSVYPAFDLYPAVYPYNLREIYPPSSFEHKASIFGTSFSAGISLDLSQVYPFVCPYPPVYPFFALYPEAAGRPISNWNPSDASVKSEVSYPAFKLYPSVYPYIDIYPIIWRVEEGTGQPQPSTIQAKAPTPQLPTARRRPTFSHSDLHQQVFSVRRRPRYSHADLHNQVFLLAEDSTLKDVPIIPIISTVITSPAPSWPIYSAPSTAQPLAPPRSRGRSGTVSRPVSVQRPAELPASISKTTPTDAANRRLSQMGDASSDSPSRPLPPRVVGLPSNPAMMRRMSVAQTRPVSAAFALLPTLAEPDDGPSGGERLQSNSASPTEAPRDRASRLPRPERAGSISATLPQRTSMANVASELMRSKTMPSSKLANRLSMVRERAKAYDQSAVMSEDAPPEATDTLSQFPVPPRFPLPSPPKVKPVSKLDRSKYPFA